jgi:hypothetical protein
MKKEYVPFVLVIIVLLIIIIMFKHCNGKEKEKSTLYEHLEDSIVFHKNRSGQKVARIQLLESNSVKDFLKIKTQDSVVKHLQAKVKEYERQIKNNGSVTKIGTFSSISNSTATVARDTIIIDRGDSLKASIYTTTFKDKWINYRIDAFPDTTYLDLKTKDNFSVILGSERPKWYKKKQPFVDVISESPYTEVKSVRAYRVTSSMKPTRLSLGIQVGYGFSSLIPKPYIGIGLQYNILNIF